MYGAILGDIIGSPFEFDRGDKTKDFELFTSGCGFTDDTVMTIAVGEALLAVGADASEIDIKDAVISNMQSWGREYPNSGYGGSFRHWLKTKNPKPYNSYGNGSAMRVSAVGWLYSSLSRTREVARYTAEVTHNHPEGIKGAEVTASCIFMARNGASKEEIKSYVEREFHYNLNRTLDEIRPDFHMDESCQGTVPESIIAFLESDSFEDAVRNAVSLGGDTDTLAAITGSIAEAFYGIPVIYIAECKNRVPEEMANLLEYFDDYLGRGREEQPNEDLDGNREIEQAIDAVYLSGKQEDFVALMEAISIRLRSEGHVMVPFYALPDNMFSDLDVYELKRGDSITLENDVRMIMDTVTEGNDVEWFYFFTNTEEANKQDSTNIYMSMPLYDAFKITAESDKVAGIVINPFGRYIKMDKELVKVALNNYENHWVSKNGGLNHGENN